MTESNVAATQRVAYAFLDAHYPWLPKPQITEWDNIAGGSRYYSTAHTIAVPKYSDAWNDGDEVIVDHECGHVVAFYLAEHGVPVLEQFLAAMDAPATLITHPLINEIWAEHFVRAYVNTYDGRNYPQLIGLVAFDAAKMRAFAEALRPIVTVPGPQITQPAPVVPTAIYRHCFDSTTAADIPAGAEIVAGYIDGIYKWSDADWALFPNSLKVRIAVFASTQDGHVLDVEPGDATPDQSVAWVLNRRAVGVDPTVYTGIGQWQACRDAFTRGGVPEPHWWIAHYDNDPTPIPGTVAKQYANPTFTGKHYDLSIVPGAWPGVEGEDMAFATDPDAQAFKKDVHDTLEEIKKVLGQLADQNRSEDVNIGAIGARIDKLRTI